jgi:nucleoside-diphosphate-sugar epimerase
MKILVTGAFGNIGTSAVQELIRQGHQVRCFALKKRKNERAARKLAGKAEVAWGDVRRPEDLAAAAEGQEAIVHLAYIIPPQSDEDPDKAQETNISGTQNVLAAAKSAARPPKILFASSFDVFGATQDQPPPRKVTDPVQATDLYTRHKLECEAMVKASGLEWAIFRFADVPMLRSPHPIMFQIPLSTRIEVIHTYDAGLAIANAMKREEVWGKVLLIGGGSRCQIFYRDYLGSILDVMGIGMLPEQAFGARPYCTDWLDTEESQHLLNYQRYSFAAIVQDLARAIGYRRFFVPPLRPMIRWWILRMSPYYRKV